jgi:flagellar biosynthesis/type III secretory pathway protein FliH
VLERRRTSARVCADLAYQTVIDLLETYEEVDVDKRRYLLGMIIEAIDMRAKAARAEGEREGYAKGFSRGYDQAAEDVGRR